MCAMVCTLATIQASAQTRFDVGLALGTTAASDAGSVLQFERGTTYQATFAWRLWQGRQIALGIEIPFIASPSFEVSTSAGPLPKEYASLYLTPGVRVTAFPNALVSIFGAVGAGYARYTEAHTRIDGTPNLNPRDTDTAALQFGGGADVRVLRWLAFRGEVRDVYTGARNFSLQTPGEPVHNLISSAALVIRF